MPQSSPLNYFLITTPNKAVRICLSACPNLMEDFDHVLIYCKWHLGAPSAKNSVTSWVAVGNIWSWGNYIYFGFFLFINAYFGISGKKRVKLIFFFFFSFLWDAQLLWRKTKSDQTFLKNTEHTFFIVLPILVSRRKTWYLV